MIEQETDDSLTSDPEVLGVDDLAIAKVLGGNIDGLMLLRAHVEKTGGEHRPQQEHMLNEVSLAIQGNHHLLAQAGTGTGKSLAYLMAVAASGKRTVIATATNQLSEQLMNYDLPAVQQTMKALSEPLTFSMLKGRSNYICKAKVAELRNLDSEAKTRGFTAEDVLFLPDELDNKSTKRVKDTQELNKILDWVNETETGNRSEAPPVNDRVWNQVSVSQVECAGRACPFFNDCFTEKARKKAKASQIVVTNHALLAQDIKLGSYQDDEFNDKGVPPTVFGPHEVLVIDEVHDFADSLTSAFSETIVPSEIDKFLRKISVYVKDPQKDARGESLTITESRTSLKTLDEMMTSMPKGIIEEFPEELSKLMVSIARQLLEIHGLLQDATVKAEKAGKPKRAIAIGLLAEQLTGMCETFVFAMQNSKNNVRWVETGRNDEKSILNVAPLKVGKIFRDSLEGRIFIGTSATVTVGDSFEPLARALGIENATKVDVGTPFEYSKQGMLYIPNNGFPSPLGRERTEHTAAVLDEIVHLVKAAGGRTLALFTTTVGAQRAAEHLRLHLPKINVYSHGDATADVLVDQFREDETSVLCATMGLWQGTNVEGPSCSLVVIDKISFAPVDDVLTVARRMEADAEGRDGFTEVIVGQAAISLAQATGRLIRTRNDKGVVAILDPRLLSKGYGRVLLQSIPPFPKFTDRQKVTDALTRLTGGYDTLPEKTVSSLKLPSSTKKRRTPPSRAAKTRKIGQPVKRRDK